MDIKDVNSHLGRWYSLNECIIFGKDGAFTIASKDY